MKRYVRAMMVGVGLWLVAMIGSGCTPAQTTSGGPDAGVAKQTPVTALKTLTGKGKLHLKAVIDSTLLVVDFENDGDAAKGYTAKLAVKIEAGAHMLAIQCDIATGGSVDVGCAVAYEFSSSRDPAMDIIGTQLLEIKGSGNARLELIARDLPLAFAFNLDGQTGEEAEAIAKGVVGALEARVQTFGAKCGVDTRPGDPIFSCAPVISFPMPSAAVPMAEQSQGGQ